MAFNIVVLAAAAENGTEFRVHALARQELQKRAMRKNNVLYIFYNYSTIIEQKLYASLNARRRAVFTEKSACRGINFVYRR